MDWLHERSHLCICNQSSFIPQPKHLTLNWIKRNWFTGFKSNESTENKSRTNFRRTMNWGAHPRPLLCLLLFPRHNTAAIHNASFNMFYKSWLMCFSEQILLYSTDTVAHRHQLKFCHSIICICFIGLGRAARRLFVWGIGNYCQSSEAKALGGNFMKWWQMQCRTLAKRQLITKRVVTAERGVSRIGRFKVKYLRWHNSLLYLRVSETGGIQRLFVQAAQWPAVRRDFRQLPTVNM